MQLGPVTEELAFFSFVFLWLPTVVVEINNSQGIKTKYADSVEIKTFGFPTLLLGGLLLILVQDFIHFLLVVLRFSVFALFLVVNALSNSTVRSQGQ